MGGSIGALTCPPAPSSIAGSDGPVYGLRHASFCCIATVTMAYSILQAKYLNT